METIDSKDDYFLSSQGHDKDSPHTYVRKWIKF